MENDVVRAVAPTNHDSTAQTTDYTNFTDSTTEKIRIICEIRGFCSGLNHSPPSSVTAEIVESMLGFWGETGQMQWLPISGRSMAPLMEDGDLLLVEFRPRALKPGHIVVFRQDKQLIAHRVISLTRQDDSVFVTAKGDNVAAFDPPCPLEDVIGRVHAIRGGGQRRLDAARWRFVGQAIAGATSMAARAYAPGTSSVASRVVRKLTQWSIRGLGRVAMLID